jgi:endonuclease-3
MATVKWNEAIQPLLKKYKGKKHPLDYEDYYQLMVMVVLSAQDSDKNINSLAPALFHAFPDMTALANATADDLFPYISKVRNFGNKCKWLLAIGQQLKTNDNIPSTMEALVKLPGIGRKSANVIMREMGKKAEGVIVDLHVVRVAPRLGIVEGTEDPKKIELQLMGKIDEKDWGEVGMAISFLGREICRPTNPKHDVCVMKDVCAFYKH